MAESPLIVADRDVPDSFDAAVVPPARPANGGLGRRVRGICKRLWRLCPLPIREAPLRALAWLLLPSRRSSAAEAAQPLFLVAPLTDASGIGNGARLHLREAIRGRRDPVAVDLTPLFRESDPRLCPFSVQSLATAARHRGAGTVILHVNPPHFLIALLMLGRRFLRGKAVVGYWAWELDDIPALWRFALRFVDRIEVPSTFAAQAIRAHTAKPVVVVPHPPPEVVPSERAYAQDGVTRVLFMFDIAVRRSRKNPLAVAAAFRQAFPGRQDVALTIKILPSAGFEAELERICAELRDDPLITVITERIEHHAVAALYRSHDIYLSLHRAEGYGLTIREAMAYGLEVVATGWSGNMDFMHGPRAHAVAYRLVPLTDDREMFSVPGARWAEPDVAHAAVILREIDARRRAGGAQ